MPRARFKNRPPIFELLEPRALLSGVPTCATFVPGAKEVQATSPSLHPQLARQAALTHTVTKLSQPHGHSIAVALGSKAFFAGGVSHDFLTSFLESAVVDIYDNSTRQWSTADLSKPRIVGGAATVGDKVVFGAGAHDATVDIYDAGSGLWSAAAFSQARGDYATASVGTKAIFAGGDATATVDIYDAVTGDWSTTTLSQPRSFPAAASVGGKAIFVGGADSTALSNTADVYDSATGQWSTATLPVPLVTSAGVTIGNLALFPSLTFEGSRSTGRMNVYDAGTGQWSAARFPKDIDEKFLGGRPPVAVTVGTKAVFPTRHGGVEVFDSIAGTWSSSAAPGRLARAFLTATAKVGTRILFAGGLHDVDGSATPSDVVAFYDTATRRWSKTTLSLARFFMTSASVGDTAIFAGDDLGYTDAIDLYTDTAPVPVLAGTISGQGGGMVTIHISNTGDADLPAGPTVTVYASRGHTLRHAVSIGQVTLTQALAAGHTTSVTVPTTVPTRLGAGSYRLMAAIDDHSGSAPTPIAAQSQTFTVRRAGTNTAAAAAAAAAASRFRGDDTIPMSDIRLVPHPPSSTLHPRPSHTTLSPCQRSCEKTHALSALTKRLPP
jgi:hypothetical protein